MLLFAALLVSLYVGFTLSRPRRDGEMIPTFVWVILFCINVFIVSLLLPIWFIAPDMPKVGGIPITAIIMPVLGLVAGPLLAWLILRARREATALDRYSTRMDARRARVEKAKREGKL